MMNAFQAELKAIVQAVNTGKKNKVLGADLARDAIAICQAQTKSLRQGKMVSLK